jgi:hypothetical protein
MKKQILNEEFKRMQRLAGIITESQLNEGIEELSDTAVDLLMDKSKYMTKPGSSKGVLFVYDLSLPKEKDQAPLVGYWWTKDSVYKKNMFTPNPDHQDAVNKLLNLSELAKTSAAAPQAELIDSTVNEGMPVGKSKLAQELAQKLNIYIGKIQNPQLENEAMVHASKIIRLIDQDSEMGESIEQSVNEALRKYRKLITESQYLDELDQATMQSAADKAKAAGNRPNQANTFQAGADKAKAAANAPTAEEKEIEAAYDKWCEDKEKFIKTEFDKIKSKNPTVYHEQGEAIPIEKVYQVDFSKNWDKGIFQYPNEYLNNPMFTITLEYEDSNRKDIFYQEHKYAVGTSTDPKFGFDMDMSKLLYTIAKDMDPKTTATIQKLGDKILLYK